MTPRPPAAAGRLSAADLAWAAALCAAKLALDAWVLHVGFTHVSDDDFARTVIAEQFAHAPRLDPSGTSWLPFPFWVEGIAMLIFGRSLAVARGVAIVVGAIAVAAPLLAMRAAGVPRAAAIVATGAASLLPWNAWLGAATVPDGWTGALLGASAIAIASEGAWPWAAAGLFATSLSRYEAWPVCAVFLLACATGRSSWASRLDPRARRAAVACAVAAVAGPALWMAWNAQAHGSPFHFVARVTAFRRAIGAASVPCTDKVLGYPRAFLEETPEAAVLAACGVAGIAGSAELRARWRWAGAAALAVVAFLIAGDLGDGAPTHHPARALASTWWIAIGMGTDAMAALAPRLRPGFAGLGSFVGFAAGRGAREPAEGPPKPQNGSLIVSLLTILVVSAGLFWVVRLPGRWAQVPGATDWERRDAQIARGLDLRARDVASVDITPCQFEQFALLAAWGEPERAHVKARTQRPITSDCPQVVELAGPP